MLMPLLLLLIMMTMMRFIELIECCNFNTECNCSSDAAKVLDGAKVHRFQILLQQK